MTFGSQWQLCGRSVCSQIYFGSCFANARVRRKKEKAVWEGGRDMGVVVATRADDQPSKSGKTNFLLSPDHICTVDQYCPAKRVGSEIETAYFEINLDATTA